MPASFDEAARELTVEAAIEQPDTVQQAGQEHLF